MRKKSNCSNNSHFKRILLHKMLVHAINVAGRFRVFGGKTIIASVMCLGLSDVRDSKPKHHLCDVFHNFRPCESAGCVFIKM